MSWWLMCAWSVWQWDQLRIMKVGGNESATKYFQSHGGSAALASKDPKQKYESNAAKKYKDELARRVSADQKLYVVSARMIWSLAANII
jgi:ADP-ribosylation factor GTPase-activating protein 2/3